MINSLLLDIFFMPFLIAAFVALMTFFLGYRLFKKYIANDNSAQKIEEEHLQVDSIAGDNIWSTKLDLARAYLETGESGLAKSVILEVASCSDAAHRNEAKLLLEAHF